MDEILTGKKISFAKRLLQECDFDLELAEEVLHCVYNIETAPDTFSEGGLQNGNGSKQSRTVG